MHLAKIQVSLLEVARETPLLRGQFHCLGNFKICNLKLKDEIYFVFICGSFRVLCTLRSISHVYLDCYLIIWAWRNILIEIATGNMQFCSKRVVCVCI